MKIATKANPGESRECSQHSSGMLCERTPRGDSNLRHPLIHLVRKGMLGAVFLCLTWLCQAASGGNQPTPVSGQDALEKMIAREEANLTNGLAAADQKARSTADSGDGLGTYMVLLAALVAGVIVLRKVWPVLVTPMIRDESSSAPVPVPQVSDPHAEVFSEFLEKFNSPSNAPSASDSASKRKRRDDTENRPAALEPQLDLALEPVVIAHVNALDQVITVRTLFLDLNRAADQASRQRCLTGLLTAVGGLRKGMRVSAAYSVGQIASALEALLSKLASQPDSLNVSTMRTLAGAIDLLPALCSPGVRSDLASNPVISLLAVDDDAVSRHALTIALKRVWARPDLANDGHEGLRLAETRPYDLIFVDIEMPGMDGFELCFKIHSTSVNALTPVVFVTSHNDLPSRAKSSLVGGFEFLGKPFLTAELTVKALTLVLKRRLQLSTQPRAAERDVQKTSSGQEAAVEKAPSKALQLQVAPAVP